MKRFHKKVKMSRADSGTKILMLWQYYVGCRIFIQIRYFLTDRKQLVVLSGQTSSWERLLSGVPQGSALGPLFFLIYINDLLDGIQYIRKIFADGTSLFSKCQDFKKSERELNEDLTFFK